MELTPVFLNHLAAYRTSIGLSLEEVATKAEIDPRSGTTTPA